MRRSLRRILDRAFVVASLAVLAACSKPMFTPAVRDRYSLSADDLRGVQFFTSEEIVLARESDVESKRLEDNQLVIKRGTRLERVVIPAHTPCVALRIEGDYLLAGFAKNDPREALWFAAQRGEGTTAGLASMRPYRLVELENDATEVLPFQPRWSPGFLARWSGAKYRIDKGRAAYLLYEIDRSLDRESVEKDAPGWRLAEGAPPAQPGPVP